MSQRYSPNGLERFLSAHVARVGGALDQVLPQHDCTPAIETLVAEMALLIAWIGKTIKLRWK